MGEGLSLSSVASEQLLRSSQCGARQGLSQATINTYRRKKFWKKINIYNTLASQNFLMFFRGI